MKHVSVDILTGFLGSGKTTLLRHVLGGALAGEKVAVVMNELGDVGVDGRVITGLDYVESVVELNSGCICCTIDDYRFDLAVRELLEAVDPTLVLIESTGVADPEPMISRVLQAGLALDAVICVVDAGAFDRACRESQVVARQVAAADFVVINKTDLVTPGDLAALRRRLARLNGRAMLVDCERGRVSTDLMFGTSARRYRDATPPGPRPRPSPRGRDRCVHLQSVCGAGPGAFRAVPGPLAPVNPARERIHPLGGQSLEVPFQLHLWEIRAELGKVGC